ncbi:MAG TPA: superoxide dismutase family protein [Planctomycetes bacterium]|nr:superoxide dismutase family protein [Planctomycetota bacterium]
MVAGIEEKFDKLLDVMRSPNDAVSTNTSKGRIVMIIRWQYSFMLALLIGFTVGCESQSNTAIRQQAQLEAEQSLKQAAAEMEMVTAQVGQVAVAVMTATAGNKTAGTVTFTQGADGIAVEATIRGLTPGDHAIHIHQFGDLRLDNGKGTGGHYNPQGHDHALPSTEMRHAGDLGNLTADADGNASYSITINNVTLDGAHNPIIGRGVIIHAKVDDGGQPTGNAGARVSQGVIGYSQPSDG